MISQLRKWKIIGMNHGLNPKVRRTDICIPRPSFIVYVRIQALSHMNDKVSPGV